MSREETRVRRIVCGVVRAALRDTETEGVVVAAPPSGPSGLLAAWLEAEGVPAAPAGEVEAVAAELGVSVGDEPETVRAAARVLARRRNLLPLHPIHKTALLLGGAPPPEPLLPLADLYASALARWCEPVPRPEVLRDRDDGALESVDRALERYLEKRMSWERATEALDDELRSSVENALARGRWYRLWSPVTPKLGPRTPGIDLDL